MLGKLSLKSRLLLIAAVPLAIMLGLGASSAWQKYSNYQARIQAGALVGLVIDLGETVHELQLERGASSRFLGSKGSEFADKLTAQRKLSDAAIARLTENIRRIDPSTVGPRYIKLLEAASEPLGELTKKREQITRLALEPDESFRFYGETISQLLEIALRTWNQMPSCNQLSAGACTFVPAHRIGYQERVCLQASLGKRIQVCPVADLG